VTLRVSLGRLRPLLVGVAVGLIWLLAAPATPAQAHAVLLRTSPAKGSTVNAAPLEVVLTFSEAVNPVEGKLRIIAPDGNRADNGEPRTSGGEVRIPMKQDSLRGTYLVTYRVISADSHPIAGSYAFNIIAPSPGGPPAADGGNANASPLVVDTIPVVRWIGYIGLLLLVGAALMLAALWPRRLDRRGPTRLIWLGAGLIAVATIGEMLLQIPYVAGGGLADIRSADVKEALSSQYGAAHLIRLGVLAAALVLLRPILRGRGWGADRVLLAVLGVIGLATWSVSGHPSASPAPMVTVVADIVHLGSMSIWLGGLVILIVFLLPQGTAAELGAIVPVWSRWATYAVSALVLTGVAQSLVEVGTFPAVFGTAYGRLVVVKAGLVSCVLAVAWFSRRLVDPVGAGAADARGRLHKVIIAEAAIAGVVLGVASVLVQVTPGRTAVVGSPESTIQSVTLTSDLFTLQAEVDPARAGSNFVHLYAYTPAGGPADVKAWVVKASMPAQGIEPIDAAIVPITLDHATGEIALPSPGTWTFAFTLRMSEIDQRTVTADIVVRP